MTRLRIAKPFSEELPAGDYEVMYVSPSAGVLQLARSANSLGQKEKPQWESLRAHAGVEIECGYCRGWFPAGQVPLDEVRGWRCRSCRGNS